MGKGPRFAQNGEVATDAVTAHDAVVSRDAAAPGRQRPEEILAQTLTGPAHPEASDGWSPRGRRVFLIALAVAGVVLLVAGLLITSELGPGPGQLTPLESVPGNGLADQLLRPVTEQGSTTPPASIGLPLPVTPTTVPSARSQRGQAPNAVTPDSAPTVDNSHSSTPTTTASTSPTTTLPCNPLSQGLQQAQLPLPCRAPAVGSSR